MKTRIQLFAFLLLFSCMTINTQAATTLTRQQSEVRVAQIQQRVDEIRSMDLTHLTKVERTGLKHELKGMNKELRSDPVIFISGGALILIIILIIILL